MLGETSSARINSMIWAIYRLSQGQNFVDMEAETQNAMDELRDFMFRTVYITPASMAEEEKANRMLEAMFNYFSASPQKLPPFFQTVAEKEGTSRAICDYLSSMSDRYAEYVFSSLFIPKSWSLI